MDVYFDENFWECRGSRHEDAPGEAIHIEEQFLWDGREMRIPAVYACEEGLVADVCIRIPAEEIEDFLNKWRSRADELTVEEQEQLEWENPLSRNLNVFLEINDERSENRSGCGTSWIPSCLEGDEAEGARAYEAEEEILMNAYGCSRTDGWKFWRHSYAWPSGKRVPVRTLCFTFEKEPDSYAGPHFFTRLGEEKKVEFIHPVSGERHMLTVQEQKRKVLPELELPEGNMGGMAFEKIPTHFLVMAYSVEPEFPRRELQILDCAESDPPVMVKKKAGAVSVIGGADGPTSIFFAGKNKTKQRNWQSACSSMHYEPVDQVEWRMTFHVKDRKNKKIKIVL